LALDSHRRRVTCCWLHGLVIDGRTSSTPSVGGVCSYWYRRLCCLGLSFSWQSICGFVAAFAGYSWLVFCGRYVYFFLVPRNTTNGLYHLHPDYSRRDRSDFICRCRPHSLQSVGHCCECSDC